MGIAIIPAASSGPTLAEITTAIQNNAAPASVTNSSIATQVANNATPFGGTWTNVAENTFSSINTVTVSSLGGYKFLKGWIVITQVPSSSQAVGFRINGDTTAGNYVWNPDNQITRSYFNFGGNAGFGMSMNFEIFPANSTSVNKVIDWKVFKPSSGASERNTLLWKNNAAVSSITLFNADSSNNFAGYIRILGAN